MIGGRIEPTPDPLQLPFPNQTTEVIAREGKSLQIDRPYYITGCLSASLRSCSICVFIPDCIKFNIVIDFYLGFDTLLMLKLLEQNRLNRSHKGCGEEWNACDVVWLWLRLDD